MRKLLMSLATLSAVASMSASAGERTMLVLDASGSMWGQIDGVPKIQIARDALKTLIKDWPADRETGLVVYGYRRKGDCGDIETVIPPGLLNAAQMQKTIAAIVPKGKTPLSAAVKQAAEALKYTEEKATVILISDGVETCNMDPCALGAELERLGVDFTAHVIGFDVNKIEDQKGLRCLAEATGGDFIPAADASELNEALEKTAKAPIVEPLEAPLPEVKLMAADTVTKGTVFEVRIEAAPKVDGRVYLYAEGKEKPVTYQRIQQSKTDDYKYARLFAPAQTGNYLLKFMTLNEKEVTQKSLQVTEAEISLGAPEQASLATEVKIKLDAPAGIEGRLFLYRKGKNKPITYQRIQKDSLEAYKPVVIRLPASSGDYELVLKTLRDEELARRDIQVVEMEIAIQAPDTAPIATTIRANIDAPPGLDGRIYLFAAGKEKYLTYQRLAKDSQDNYKPVRLRLPARPGDYVIRFRSLNEEPLAEKAITVVPAEISLNAPSEAAKDSIIEVTPVGPAGIEGRIYLYLAGKDKAVTFQRVVEGRIDDYDPVRLKLPPVAGDFVLRLLSAENELLAEKPIRITE